MPPRKKPAASKSTPPSGGGRSTRSSSRKRGASPPPPEASPSPAKARSTKGRASNTEPSPSPTKSRPGRGKKASPAPESPKEETTTSRGPGRGKATQETPSPQAKGRGRGRQPKQEKSSAEEESLHEVKTPPSRGRRSKGTAKEKTPVKEVVKKSPVVGRKSRGTPKRDIESSETSVEPPQKVPSPAVEKEKKKVEETPTKPATPKKSPQKSPRGKGKTKIDPVVTVERTDVCEAAQAQTECQQGKRKRDDADEAVAPMKKPKISEDNVGNVEDYVVVNKDDVPPADSAEVQASEPRVVQQSDESKEGSQQMEVEEKSDAVTPPVEELIQPSEANVLGDLGVPVAEPMVQTPAVVEDEVVKEVFQTLGAIEVEQEANAQTSSEPSHNYVMINKDEIPAPDSREVLDAIPKTPETPSHPESDSGVNGCDNGERDLSVLFNRSYIPNPNVSSSDDTSGRFTLVQYNILAECHRKRSDYSFTPEKYLSFPYRHERFMEELRYLDGDVVCLQEVEPLYFQDTLLPEMKKAGYDGLFKQRVRNEIFLEGEATFFRTSRFTLVEHSSHSLADLADKDVDESELTDDVKQAVKKFLSHSAVLLITKLQCKNTGRVVTVGNVHINWAFGFALPDVQCSQITCAIRQLVSDAGGVNNAHIISGDFNTKPGSACYQLTGEGYLNDENLATLQALQQVDLPDNRKAALVNLLWKDFQHTSPNLKSAYFTAMGKEPPTSSLHSSMNAMVDYIWYSETGLQLNGILQTAKLNHKIPSIVFPSDHISLKADFTL